MMVCLISSQVYSVLRNLGYTSRLSDLVADSIRTLIGKTLSDDRKLEREKASTETLSVLAPLSNIAVGVGPVIVLLLLGAEQLFKAIAPYNMREDSYFSGGILAAWRGDVKATDTAVMLVGLCALRFVFFKLELWFADRDQAKSIKARGN